MVPASGATPSNPDPSPTGALETIKREGHQQPWSLSSEGDHEAGSAAPPLPPRTALTPGWLFLCRLYILWAILSCVRLDQREKVSDKIQSLMVYNTVITVIRGNLRCGVIGRPRVQIMSA